MEGYLGFRCVTGWPGWTPSSSLPRSTTTTLTCPPKTGPILMLELDLE